MKRLLIALACLALSVPCLAQNADEPASKDEVLQFLRTMRSRDMMQKMVDAVLKPIRQMQHDQLMKEKENLPPDFEARMNKMMEDMLKGMPFDEMMQAMVPAYQKHFTHGDMEALSAFYSSPVGQKFLNEIPAVTGDAMQAMIPIMTRYTQQWQERMLREMKEMKESSPKKAGEAPPSHN